MLAADEERVDELVDAVENPDQLEPEADQVGALDAIETVGALFVAADRLMHDPGDSEGTIAAADAARAMAPMAPPFGFAPAAVGRAGRAGHRARRLLETEAEVVDDDAVVEAATKLRAALRPYV